MFITIQIKHSAYVTSIMLLLFHVLTIKVNALTPFMHKHRYHDYEVDAVKHFNYIDGATLLSGWLCVGVELSCCRVAPLCKCSGNFWWTAPSICRSQYLASLTLTMQYTFQEQHTYFVSQNTFAINCFTDYWTFYVRGKRLWNDWCFQIIESTFVSGVIWSRLLLQKTLSIPYIVLKTNIELSMPWLFIQLFRDQKLDCVLGLQNLITTHCFMRAIIIVVTSHMHTVNTDRALLAVNRIIT